MNNAVLILGNSGTGKSTSIRNLPPEETFILNIGGKPLPFRGSSKKYKKLSPDGMEGNYYCSDNPVQIKRIINLIDQKRPSIKYLILDDFGFMISNEFMRKSMIKGWDKFVEISKDFSDIISLVKSLRDDLFCFVTMHIDTDSQGMTKPRSVGKMIDQYVIPEAHFSYVFHTIVNDGNYRFITNNDNFHMCKTPMGLFSEQYIDNDMLMIANKINEYNNEDIEM